MIGFRLSGHLTLECQRYLHFVSHTGIASHLDLVETNIGILWPVSANHSLLPKPVICMVETD